MAEREHAHEAAEPETQPHGTDATPEQRQAAIDHRRQIAADLEAQAATAPQDAEDAAEAARLAASDIEEPFRRGRWGAYANFECKYCLNATLSEQQAWMHYSRGHLGQAPQQGG